jgi:hypothetical protein
VLALLYVISSVTRVAVLLRRCSGFAAVLQVHGSGLSFLLAVVNGLTIC